MIKFASLLNVKIRDQFKLKVFAANKIDGKRRKYCFSLFYNIFQNLFFSFVKSRHCKVKIWIKICHSSVCLYIFPKLIVDTRQKKVHFLYFKFFFFFFPRSIYEGIQEKRHLNVWTVD